MALTERLALLVDAKTGGAVSEFKKLGSAADGVDKKGGKASRAVEALGGKTVLAGAAMGAAAAAGAGLVAFTASAVGEFNDLAGKVREFSRASGASAEESSRFVAVLDDMGVEAEVGGKALQKLARADTKKLSELGVTLAKNADGTTNLTESLLNVADAYQRTADPAKRAELLFAAFGRQGQQLIPVLEKGRSGLKQFFDATKGSAQILSQDDLDRAEEFRLAMDSLGDAVQELKIDFARGLVPVLADTAEDLSTLIGGVHDLGNAIPGSGTVLRSAFKAAEGPLGFLADGIDKLRGNSDDAAGAQDGLAQSTNELAGEQLRLKASAEDAADAQKNLEQAAKDQAKALDDVLQAQLAQFDSSIAQKRAISGLYEAFDTYTDSLKANRDRTKDNNVSAHDLERQHLDLQDAILNAAGAAVKAAEDQAAAAGRTLTEKQKYDTFRAALKKLEEQFPHLKGEIEAYVKQLGGVPPKVVTELSLKNFKTAMANVDAYVAGLRVANGLLADVSDFPMGQTPIPKQAPKPKPKPAPKAPTPTPVPQAAPSPAPRPSERTNVPRGETATNVPLAASYSFTIYQQPGDTLVTSMREAGALVRAAGL